MEDGCGMTWLKYLFIVYGVLCLSFGSKSRVIPCHLFVRKKWSAKLYFYHTINEIQLILGCIEKRGNTLYIWHFKDKTLIPHYYNRIDNWLNYLIIVI